MVYRKHYLVFPVVLSAIILFAFHFAVAQENGTEERAPENDAALQVDTDEMAVTGEEFFEARVTEIVEQREIRREDGSVFVQQDLSLKGLSGKWKDKEIEFKGISDLEVASAGVYRIGDRVSVQHLTNAEGEEKYYVTDFVRRGYLYWLGLLFCLVIMAIGRKKGIRSLIGLAVSFLIIVKFILPEILSGTNPLAVGLTGAFAILAVMIYLTEGWNRKSHLALLAVFISLVVTFILSWLFTNLTRLSGLAQEESVFLIGLTKTAINFQGLLLTGMLIGAIGVLDDVIVSQIEAVRQIKAVNPEMNKKDVYKAAYKIGNTHLGTMVNTLFLTYAGASLPLLLLFSVNQGAFLTFGQVINNEVIATEVVRTLVGSIGVALAMPIATFLGAYFYRPK